MMVHAAMVSASSEAEQSRSELEALVYNGFNSMVKNCYRIYRVPFVTNNDIIFYFLIMIIRDGEYV